MQEWKSSLMSEIVVAVGYFPNEVLAEGSDGEQTMSEHFSLAKILSATSEMRESKSGLTLILKNFAKELQSVKISNLK